MSTKVVKDISHLNLDQFNIDQTRLDSINVEQGTEENRKQLDILGGVDGLATKLSLNPKVGLTANQVESSREKFGTNDFPESPMNSFFTLFIGAFNDPVLLILLVAALVSLIVGIFEDPHEGWIEGVAIFVAVFLVALIGASNDYTKELQFRALEATSSNDERSSVLRDGVIDRINPKDLVVGDVLVLQAGDLIPADCLLVSAEPSFSNEASLTGEPDDLKKTKEKDCFLLSACLVTDGEECRAIVVGIGTHSQWGKIKANLVSESVNTPLQDKLEAMTELIGYIGMACAAATFIALVVRIWADAPEGHELTGAEIGEGFINAFILAVTIIVVAIPEGLPLAVTISLAYSTKKMYKDQCFIRVLSACETMGNATNICSDKTGKIIFTADNIETKLV
jgi:calcium-translocating P-type ATPase